MKRFMFLFLFVYTSLYSAKTDYHFEYLFPVPESTHLPLRSDIIIRFRDHDPDQILNLSTFYTITGELSGNVQGRVVVSSDKRTMIIRPTKPFQAGERVSIHLSPQIDPVATEPIQYSFGFTIKPEQQKKPPPKNSQSNDISILPKKWNRDPVILDGVALPSDFPRVNITVSDNPTEGFLFLNARSNKTYSMILDNEGNPQWFWPHDREQWNFRSYPDGRLSVNTWIDDIPSILVFDSTYTVVDTITAPPGYWLDRHEGLLLSNGHSLIIANDERQVDRATFIPGGTGMATVLGNNVMELDENKIPVFIWRCWDYFDIPDAIHVDILDEHIDYVHMNSIDVDLDEHLIISSRHLSEVTKIHRQTGAILWRLGGKNDEFTWMNDTDRISWQHTITDVSDGQYLIFDNGNHHDPPYSRALEVKLDTVNRTCTKIWEFRDSPDTYTAAQCNAQRLSDGNTLINWFYKLNEVRANGTKVFEMNFENGSGSYRAFRHPWRGKASIPALIAESYSDRITLIFNKFGDSDVSHYNIYGGMQPESDQVIATAEKPFIHLDQLTNETTYYFRVTAVNGEGEESGYSNEVDVFVNFIPAGSNMVLNGDFSNGMQYWHTHENSATTNWYVTDSGELKIINVDGGTDLSQVLLYYENLPLVEKTGYRFEFDAYSDQGRIISAEVMNSEGSVSYSQIGYTWLTSTKQHFSFEFDMEEMSDGKSQVRFQVGGSNHDVYLDNVSLKQIVTNIGPEELERPAFTLSQNHPNPFNSVTALSYSIPEKSYIKVNVYDINGRLITVLVDGMKPAGHHSIQFDGSDLATGVYFYQLSGSTLRDHVRINMVQKMILLK